MDQDSLKFLMVDCLVSFLGYGYSYIYKVVEKFLRLLFESFLFAGYDLLSLCC
jgi:hypothetical protein